ncbi:MAG: undecaprenyl-phosphate glucose phosphotransferase [bacterium]|nr:undecaprenyl-phosphate glucose phosphotransferase [bacterium]
MIHRNQKKLNQLNVLSDGGLIALSYIFSSWLWLDVIKNTEGNMAALSSLNGKGILIAVTYAIWTVFLLSLFRVYRTSRVHRARRESGRILAGNAIALATAASALFLFRLQHFSRGVLTVYFLSSSAALIGKRVAVRWLLRRMRVRGYNLKHMLVVGSGKLARQYMENVRADPTLGIHVEQCLTPAEGLLEKLEGCLHDAGIDEVILALAPNELGVTADVIQVCEKCGTKISVVPFYNDIIPTCPTIDMVGSVKLIQLRTTPLDEPINALIKRGFDIVVSGLLLVVFSPLFLVLAIAIRLSSPGPVLFRQERVGLNKKPFTMYKFRSMRVNDEQDTAWSGSADSRRTLLGSLLRKISLDELPQLFNVFRGEMSLVGPRPEIPFHVERFRETVPLYMVKYQVRPGMTGWAQIHGLRGDTSIPARVEHDLWYIENWSLGLDIYILLKTALGGMVNQEKVGSAAESKRKGGKDMAQ